MVAHASSASQRQGRRAEAEGQPDTGSSKACSGRSRARCSSNEVAGSSGTNVEDSMCLNFHDTPAAAIASFEPPLLEYESAPSPRPADDLSCTDASYVLL